MILGGHSFIGPLGRDPEPSPAEKTAIVAACLGQGARVFDTTYACERVAFARAVSGCPARGRATARPIVWNFFGPLTDPLPEPSPWTEERLREAMAELSPWAGRPVLVVHAVGDVEVDQEQVACAARWKRQGRVAAVGVWPGRVSGWSRAEVDAVDFVVGPWNVACAGATRPIFVAARQRGLATVGTSPFTRGWEVDRLAKRLAVLEQRPVADARARVADALLRFAAFSPEVDHLIVAMRRSQYVKENFASLGRGPLTPLEHRWLAALARTAAVR